MLSREFCRGLIVQCAMRPMLVVISAPSGDQDTSLWQARKPVVIQELIPEAAVEALDKGILRGFAGLDQLELNTMLASPLTQSLTSEFRTLISSNGLGVAPETNRLVEDARHVVP